MNSSAQHGFADDPGALTDLLKNAKRGAELRRGGRSRGTTTDNDFLESPESGNKAEGHGPVWETLAGYQVLSLISSPASTIDYVAQLMVFDPEDRLAAPLWAMFLGLGAASNLG